MGITKGLAFFSVIFIGFGLFATVIYQSGVIQSFEQDTKKLISNEIIQKTTQKTKKDTPIPISNPNGNTAIAIIRSKPPLENIILDALESDSFDLEF